MELLRVTVVASDGHLVYDSFVKPESHIIDYNTRFSGITADDLNENATKSLRDVQNDLMGFINADTILVGHGLQNDLRVLRIIHANVVDTSIVFPHSNGLPYRRSLKSLVSQFLERDIQQDSSGHCSFEDARACMELMLWRIRTDFDNIFRSGMQNFWKLQDKLSCIYY
jgi:RNA exonuclease 1